MGIRKYKPTTPGRRGASVADFSELTRSTPEKSLLKPLPRKAGRNNAGRITTRHQGGGHKRQYRVIDFRRADKDGVPAKVAHIVNLGTVEHLAATISKEIHPLRFRANIYLDGWKPWSEFDLIGKTIRVGGVDFKVTKRVVRCAATEVNPQTAERDIDIPEAVWRKTGENDLGIYARAISAGKIAPGDKIEILG